MLTALHSILSSNWLGARVLRALGTPPQPRETRSFGITMSIPVPDAPMPALAAGVKVRDTAWLPRILWALEWSRRNGGAPLCASDIARVLSERAGAGVAASNVARAFRDLDGDPRAAGLWSTAEQEAFTTGKRYAITRGGTELLLSTLQ